jgi:hypothetical protein
MHEGGYDEFPYAVGRMTKASGEVYGRGCGQTVLPDVKLLNEMKKTTIQGAQMTIRPPMVMPHDGYLLPLRMIPGGILFGKPGRNGDDIKPLVTNARIDFGIQMIEMVKKQIMEGYLVERLQLPQGPQMTATEVQSREGIMYRYMGPMLANLHHQFLRPLIDNLVDIGFRRMVINENGEKVPLLGIPPKVLQAKKIDVKFSSPVARRPHAAGRPEGRSGPSVGRDVRSSRPERLGQLQRRRDVSHHRELLRPAGACAERSIAGEEDPSDPRRSPAAPTADAGKRRHGHGSRTSRPRRRPGTQRGNYLNGEAAREGRSGSHGCQRGVRNPAGKRVLHGLMADAGFFSAGVPSSGEEALALCAKRSPCDGPSSDDEDEARAAFQVLR